MVAIQAKEQPETTGLPPGSIAGNPVNVYPEQTHCLPFR